MVTEPGFIAPGAPVPRGGWARGVQALTDLLIAVGLIWSLPVAAAILVWLFRLGRAALR
jgi:hypothetical protein